MKSQGMTSDVSSVSVQSKLIIQLLHCLSLAVKTLPRLTVLWVKLVNVD